MGFADLLMEYKFGAAKDRMRGREEDALMADFVRNPSATLPQGITSPEKLVQLQDFIKQREIQAGTDTAFKELSPFLQPSMSSATRGQMPTQQQFVTDAAQWAQGQGIDPKYAIPAIEKMQGLKQFEAQPKIEKFGETPYIVNGTTLTQPEGYVRPKKYETVNGVLGEVTDSGFTPVEGAPTKKVKPDAIIDKLDLGDKWKLWLEDGSIAYEKKTASPNTVITQDTRRATDEMGIRKEFLALPEVKSHVEISSQVQRLEKAMEENKKGGSKVAVDQALITILNKMLDPSSVVRESEYARTPGDLAFLNRMRGKIEKLNTGGAGLTDEDRGAIADMSRNFASVSQNMYDQQEQYYTDLATRYNYNPENVVRLGGKKGRDKKETAEKGKEIQSKFKIIKVE